MDDETGLTIHAFRLLVENAREHDTHITFRLDEARVILAHIDGEDDRIDEATDAAYSRGIENCEFSYAATQDFRD